MPSRIVRIIFLVENSNSSIPSNVEKKERKKFLLNFYLCFWPLGSLYAMLHFLSSSPFAVPLPPCRKCILARLLAAAWNADGETHKTTIHLHPAPPFFSPLRRSSVSSQNLSLLASPSALWPFTRVFELVFGSYLLRYATPVSSRSFARLDPVKVFPRQRYGNTVEESKIIGPVSLFITREKFLWNVEMWKLKKLFHVTIFVIKHFYLQGSHFKYLLLNYNDNEKKDLINEFRDLREREREWLIRLIVWFTNPKSLSFQYNLLSRLPLIRIPYRSQYDQNAISPYRMRCNDNV